MSSNSHGVSLLRSAFLAVAASLLFGGIAVAGVPGECRRAPFSLRCFKALWRGTDGTNGTHGTNGTNGPEGAEDGHRDRRPPARPVPYAGPPPVANAHAVKTPPLRKMPVIPPPKRGENVERREPVRPARPADDRPADTGRQNAMGLSGSAPGSGGVSFEGVGTGLASFGASAIDGVVAEIEVTSDAYGLELDPALTMLTDQNGTQKATAGNGRLRLSPRTSRSVPR
jgi:hypothetical protein